MYSLYLRERIVRLYESGLRGMSIDTLEEEGFKVSRSGAHYVIKKYTSTGSIHDRPRSWRPRSLSENTHKKIDRWLFENNELTTSNILTTCSIKEFLHLNHLLAGQFKGWVGLEGQFDTVS